jgi:hypothetical protein
MPRGRYTVMDGDGRAEGHEEFRCAPGPMGWRYFSDIEVTDPQPRRAKVDLAVDSTWRPVRTRVDSGSHDILLTAEAERLSGFRDREPIEIAWGADVELDYASPAYNAVTANRLDRTAEFDVVFLDPLSCEPRLERQRYELVGGERVTTPVGRFDATRWRFTALSTGWTRDFWVAADVVVRYEGLFELERYEPGAAGPPVVA